MLTPVEKLPVLIALEKAVKDEIKVIRRECDDTLLEGYEDAGYEKRALKVGGQKVGEFTVTFNSEGFEIVNRPMFEEFALDYGMAYEKRTIRPDMMESAIKALEAYFPQDVIDQTVQTEVVLHPDWEKAMENVGGVVQYMDSGMNVPGVAVRPKTVKGTRVTGCKPQDVIPRLNQLDGGVTALLTGGAA